MVRVIVPQRGEKRALLELATRNAALAYDTRFNEGGIAHYDALELLRGALGLAAVPQRIDCFDISTFQGSETVASMVVFAVRPVAMSASRKRCQPSAHAARQKPRHKPCS